jgi:DNA-binding transcriptional LysR family regulator
MLVRPDRAQATLQAGAQRILDAVQAARDGIAGISGQIRGTVTLGTTLHTLPLDLARVLANVRDRHSRVVIKLRQSKGRFSGLLQSVGDGQWISPYALEPPNMSPINRRVESYPPFA